jgi:hypothetical protein
MTIRARSSTRPSPTEGKILSTKYEILNNIKALMTKIQNELCFDIWIWDFEFV